MSYMIKHIQKLQAPSSKLQRSSKTQAPTPDQFRADASWSVVPTHRDRFYERVTRRSARNRR